MKCKNTRYDHECHPIYAAKYDGYCLNCANAGVPELDGQIADLRAQVFGHCGTAVSDALTPERLAWLRQVHNDRVPTCDECMLLSELDARDRQLAELRADAEEITRIAHTAINELVRANRIQDSARLRIALLRYQAKYLPPTAKGEQP